MTLYALGDLVPSIDPDAWVHPQATIIGQVTVGPESTIWPQAVLRGDVSHIRIGAQTSIQDGAVLHGSPGLDTVIGDRCVVGHLAHLEGCVVEDDCLIGVGSVVLHRARVHTQALVGAGAVLPNGFDVPSRAIAVGVPARLRLDAVSIEDIERSVRRYVDHAHAYRAGLRVVG